MTTRSKARRRRGGRYDWSGVPQPVEPDAEMNRRRYPTWWARDALDFWPTVIDKPLFVYFIQGEEGGPVKIGKAVNPEARVRELQCGNPDKLWIRAVILGTDKVEELIHSRWKPVAHVRGEWFGHGFESALITLGEEVCKQQLAAYRQEGERDLYEIADRIPSAICWPADRALGEAA